MSRLRPSFVALAVLAMASPALTAPPTPVAGGASPVAQARSALLARMKTTKKKVDPAKVASIFTTSGATRSIKTRNGKSFTLETTDPMPIGSNSAEPAEVSKYKPYFENMSMEPANVPPLMAVFQDHTARQTPVKDQKSRGTCMAFATVAAFESHLKWKKNVTADISEEHLYKLTKDSVQKDCNSDGTNFPGIMNAIGGKRICSEEDLPYAAPSQCVVPSPCTSNAPYQIERFVIIPKDPAASGSTFVASNVKLIEAFIDLGYDVSMSLHVAGTGWHDDADYGVIDVQLNGDGTPVAPYGGHGVAFVGYHRTDRYFIFKNSWGPDWGRCGYARISYDYVQTYAKGALVILEATKTSPPVQRVTTPSVVPKAVVTPK